MTARDRCNSMKFTIEEIWIDEDARDEPLTAQIVSKLPAAKIFEGNDCADRLWELNLGPDPLSQGKKILRLMKHKGAFLKPCPGTPNYICCGLEILHIGQGCPMDCRYCALQVYFNRPVLEVFVNTADMIKALKDHLERNSQRFHRICTGEFTDSLALDPLTGLSSRLVDFFSNWTNASLEIKTKTDSIDPLLDLDPPRASYIELFRQCFACGPTRREEGGASRKKAGCRRPSAKIGIRYRTAFRPDHPDPWLGKRISPDRGRHL